MRVFLRSLVLATAVCGLAGCPQVDLSKQQKCNWTQWGQGPSHSGQEGCVPGQRPDRLLARFAYDPFSDQEAAETPGSDGTSELTIHYTAPLAVDDDVYVVVKHGVYIPCEPPGSFMQADGGSACGLNTRNQLIWSVKAMHWNGDVLTDAWSYDSDWKPASFVEWEPPLQPAVAGDFIYVPGAGGTLDQVRRSDGTRVKRVDPFHDPDFLAVSGVAAGPHGDLYYSALKLPTDSAPVLSALVHVTSDGAATTKSYTELVPSAPTGTCFGTFRTPTYARPFPPVDDAGVFRPTPTRDCSPQRPAISAVPAIGADGTVYVVSRAHDNSNYGYLVAASATLTPKWAASLRDRLNDGCGVTNPANARDNPDGGRNNTGRCRVGAMLGVDPTTNLSPAGLVDDSSSSSPVVFPDGTVAYGAVNGYNTSRGHLMHFSASGDFLDFYDFGWDVTPATWSHDGSYSVITKDNHYFEWDGSPSRFYLTSLSPQLTPEWKYQNTNTLACTEDGGCVDDHPDGFEWCINAPAIDSEGTVFGNAEDGNLYVVAKDGTELAHRFLKLAIGASYTPLTLDAKGRIYALNGGELFVLGK